jgi:hypothetical protein
MPRQQEDLAGVEGEGVSQPKIKAVEDGFEALLNARTNRMKWGTKEKDAQTELIALMEKHELELYNYDDVVYQLKDIKKVVRVPKDGEDD